MSSTRSSTPAHAPLSLSLPDLPGSLSAALPPAPAVPPPSCEVPHFSPLHVRGGSARLRRALRRRRRSLAAGLAVAAVTLALGTRDGAGGGAGPEPAAVPASAARPAELVSAPVRIADAAAVRLLEPGDRVDVVAAGGGSGGNRARVLASGARVAQVPGGGGEGFGADTGEGAGGTGEVSFGGAEMGPGGGALVVLEVTRPVATALVGAGADTPLAVTLR
ncbi:hypothetical protein [Streptomyces indicus]|uniref:Flp pilus assembly protein RcpC/CpaB n=1 Tax=Streptomyces indicus TaxID=417292 RepID=A0A1G9GZU9_9ACTN|nr:hypothetical protein [Streptomyces indicus]SDL06250.1 hypothetical protein SAMN05421806_117121 [Streptomyces indicus]